MAALPTTDQVRAISASAFFHVGVPDRTTVGESGLLGMRRRIIGYRLASNASNEQRSMAMASLTLRGRSLNGDPPLWQTLVLTFTGLAFPEIVPSLQASSQGEITFLPFPADFVAAIDAVDGRLETDPDAKITIPFPAEFPIGPSEMTTPVANCANMLGCYGYYALMVHLMGKKITDDTREVMTVRRPQNIIDGFQATNEAYILTGDGKMSDYAHSAINLAWDLLGSVREELIPRFARLGGSNAPPGRIVHMMFEMLRHSGMQPAALIHQLIAAHPWVHEIDILRPEYDYYVTSVMEYSRMDPIVRPFVKVMYGNSTKIFHAKTMANLTACAVLFLTTTNPSLNAYTAPGGEVAKRVFMAELVKRGFSLTPAATAGQAQGPGAQSTTV